MKHNPQIVKAFFRQYGIPEPVFELKFHNERRWRFDLSWKGCTCSGQFKEGSSCGMGCLENVRVALEIQGGIFIQGRHSRGAALLKEWEKLNEAACDGWRILYCQPKDLLTKQMADTIRRALCLG